MYIIHELNARHIQELHELSQNEWWSKGRSLDDTRACVNEAQIHLGVIDENEVLQAFIRIVTDFTYTAVLCDLIVSPNYRGYGLGGQLVTLVINHKKLMNVKQFELYCLPDKYPFFEKYGFSWDKNEFMLMRYKKVKNTVPNSK